MSEVSESERRFGTRVPNRRHRVGDDLARVRQIRSARPDARPGEPHPRLHTVELRGVDRDRPQPLASLSRPPFAGLQWPRGRRSPARQRRAHGALPVAYVRRRACAAAAIAVFVETEARVVGELLLLGMVVGAGRVLFALRSAAAVEITPTALIAQPWLGLTSCIPWGSIQRAAAHTVANHSQASAGARKGAQHRADARAERVPRTLRGGARTSAQCSRHGQHAAASLSAGLGSDTGAAARATTSHSTGRGGRLRPPWGQSPRGGGAGCPPGSTGARAGADANPSGAGAVFPG